MAGEVCSIPGCGGAILNVRGWCNRHYLRWRRHGDPLAGGENKRGQLVAEVEQAIATATRETCWDWPYSTNKTGYAALAINGKMTRAARYICKRVHGPPPTQGHQAAHNCGNRRCINPHHIEWKTRKENEADKLLHGTRHRGEQSVKAKLTEAQVREILRQRASGATMKALSEQFGVAHSTIQSILERRNWRHIEEKAA